MPITPHGQRHFDSAALYHLRHREEVKELTTPEGAVCRRTEDNTPLTWYVATRNDIDVHITQMIFNWRVITAPVAHPMLLNGGWCYFGTGFESFTRALNAAHTYQPEEGVAPDNYDKEVLPLWL